MDIKHIEKSYERMSDIELIRIATHDARGLRPEVFGIIEKEIKKRNLDPAIFDAVLVQNKEYSVDELNSYANLLRELPCPYCDSPHEKLNGTVTHAIKTFVFFTIFEIRPVIACPDCLDKKNTEATAITALLGWWGIAGIFRAPYYIYQNVKARKENRMGIPNKTLLSFTLGKIGEIELHKNNKEGLKAIIRPGRE